MCHKLLKQYLLLLCILATFQVTAQTTTAIDTKSNRENAPYSRFGIGEFRSGTNPLLRGMGSISAAYSSPFAVNTQNPASYGSLLLTTYEGALEGSSRTIVSGSDKYKTGMATINSMNIGIPVARSAAIAFGFRPMTHIYFNLQDTSAIAGYGNSIRTYFGDGSLNYAFFGAAYRYKGLSVGANFGYLFGTTVYATRLEGIDNTINVSDAQFARIIKTGGIYWQGGLQYATKLNNNLWIRSGATLTLSQTLKSNTDNYWVSYNVSGGDTSYSNLGQKANLTLPMMYSAGVQLADSNKWLVGIDFSAADWSNYSSEGRTDSVANMSYKLGIGGQFTPDATSVHKYFNRVTYRAGFYYGKDYIDVRNTPVNFYAVTLGTSLPFNRGANRVNMAIEVGKRGTETNGLFMENFVKFSAGITLNDKWF
ncbi:MAG: hypothetical protein KDC11_11495, partial [Chitinophagaceae bacterium]|nr:hypothetical protein [Chitinophagaceae bacterium]